MTPEQRAKMEAAMRRGGQGPQTTVRKTCVRKETLGKPSGNDEERKSCKPTMVTSSAIKQDIHMECENGGGKQTGTFKVEAVDRLQRRPRHEHQLRFLGQMAGTCVFGIQ